MMTPFVPVPIDEVEIRLRMAKFGQTEAQIKQYVTSLRTGGSFANNLYHVLVRKEHHSVFGTEIAHLSIKRLDRAPIHDWRELQWIKNMLVGTDCEGLELYPSEDRVADSANQYHLWVFTDPNFRIPLGFNSGRFVVSPEEAAKHGAGQREFK